MQKESVEMGMTAGDIAVGSPHDMGTTRDCPAPEQISTKLDGAIRGLFDSHAHYYDAKFSSVPGGADALLAQLFGDGTVSGIINVATNLSNAECCVQMAQRYHGMYAAIGIHPEDCEQYEDPERALASLACRLTDPAVRLRDKLVAIGEIGLDYHYEPFDRAKQAWFLEAQLSLAERTGLPVILHDREAHGDCFEAVLRHKAVTGVFHSFSGSAELAHELVRRGWYVSFSGVVTFRNATRVREVAVRIPPDRLLIETDCPYLAPHPHRGEMNHSGYLMYTAETLAGLYGVEIDQLIRQTRENTQRLFGLPSC